MVLIQLVLSGILTCFLFLYTSVSVNKKLERLMRDYLC